MRFVLVGVGLVRFCLVVWLVCSLVVFFVLFRLCFLWGSFGDVLLCGSFALGLMVLWYGVLCGSLFLFGVLIVFVFFCVCSCFICVWNCEFWII